MIISVGFLVIMVLAGGLVALIADKLGRTLGKKRLTLFGMRPRHTATAITVFAGMLIPLLTVIFVAVLSKATRDWLVEGPHALEQRDELRKENKALEEQKEQTSKEIQGMQKGLNDGQQKLREVNEKYARVNEDFKKLRLHASQLTSQINNYQSQILAMRRTLLTADLDVKKARANVTTLTARYGTLNKSYETLQGIYKEVDRQRQQANAEQEKLSAENEQLGNLNTSLKAKNDKASADLRETNTQLATAQSNLEFASLQLDQLKALLAENKKYLQWADDNVNNTRRKRQIFTVGEELTRIMVPAKSNANTARGLYVNLMKKVQAIAMGRGALPNRNPAAAILFIRPGDKGQDVTPDDQQETIIRGMTNSDVDLVVIAVCELNVYDGESVPVGIVPYNDPVIYKRDGKIAETMINGNVAEELIVQHLSDFLTTTVKPKALADGMIPVAGQQESFGNVSLGDLIRQARAIKDKARPVRVTALADVDTRAGDPLRLHFKVR